MALPSAEMEKVVQRWREQKTILTRMCTFGWEGGITHCTHEGRIGNSNYERINQTETKCQHGIDEKGYGCSERGSTVLTRL